MAAAVPVTLLDDPMQSMVNWLTVVLVLHPVATHLSLVPQNAFSEPYTVTVPVSLNLHIVRYSSQHTCAPTVDAVRFERSKGLSQGCTLMASRDHGNQLLARRVGIETEARAHSSSDHIARDKGPDQRHGLCGMWRLARACFFTCSWLVADFF